jgi:hypothetical protein
MLEKLQLKSLSVDGALGILAGIGVVSWVEPTTTPGAGLLLVVTVLAVGVASTIVRRTLFRDSQSAQRSDSKRPRTSH